MPSRAATDFVPAFLVRKLCFLASPPPNPSTAEESLNIRAVFVVASSDPRALALGSTGVVTGAGLDLGRIRSAADDYLLLGIDDGPVRSADVFDTTRRELEGAVLSIVRVCKGLLMFNVAFRFDQRSWPRVNKASGLPDATLVAAVNNTWSTN
jgi:hypothetical protein